MKTLNYLFIALFLSVAIVSCNSAGSGDETEKDKKEEPKKEETEKTDDESCEDKQLEEGVVEVDTTKACREFYGQFEKVVTQLDELENANDAQSQKRKEELEKELSKLKTDMGNVYEEGLLSTPCKESIEKLLAE